jgi:hypothetical protein
MGADLSSTNFRGFVDFYEPMPAANFQKSRPWVEIEADCPEYL